MTVAAVSTGLVDATGQKVHLWLSVSRAKKPWSLVRPSSEKPPGKGWRGVGAAPVTGAIIWIFCEARAAGLFRGQARTKQNGNAIWLATAYA